MKNKQVGWLPVTESMPSHRPQAEVELISTVIGYRWPLDKAFLEQEYVVKGKSMAQIGREAGFARPTVSESLMEFGIDRRPERPAHYRRGQVPYGFKVAKGGIVPHLQEQRTISDLRVRREQGASYGDLADWLNGEGVKTKNKAKCWDRPTVYKILQARSKTEVLPDPRARTT
jgi:Recombinase